MDIPCGRNLDAPSLSERIPNSTLRHFAHFIASEAHNPSLTSASELFALLRASPDMQRRAEPYSLNLTGAAGAAASKPEAPTTSPETPVPDPLPTVGALTALPTELLTLLETYLDPADLVCLGQTERTLAHALDYRLSDLGALAAAWEPTALVHDRGVRAALARQRYDATARMDRDRLAALEDGGDAEELVTTMTCGVCVRRHPRGWFAGAQQAGECARGRRCRAAEARIRVCEHWSEDLLSLRARRRRARCGGRPRTWWEECEHPSHRLGTERRAEDGGDGGFGAPCMLEFGGMIVVERTMMLLRTKQPRRRVGFEMVLDALRRRAEVSICPHVRLGDESVITAFEGQSRALRFGFRRGGKKREHELPEYEIMGCQRCGCHWSFETKTFEGRTTVQLNVDLQLPVLKDPWDQDYLRNAEGGTELWELTSGKR